MRGLPTWVAAARAWRSSDGNPLIDARSPAACGPSSSAATRAITARSSIA